MELETANKIKILKELQKNGRASLYELAEKTGLTRQTVSNLIEDMEKRKLIWGYTAIFDPKLMGKKKYIFLITLDLSENIKDLIKQVIDSNVLDQNEEEYGFKTTMYLQGDSDMIVTFWTKDTAEAKKILNKFKSAWKSYIKEIKLFEVISTFRNSGIKNPKLLEEWNNLFL